MVVQVYPLSHWPLQLKSNFGKVKLKIITIKKKFNSNISFIKNIYKDTIKIIFFYDFLSLGLNTQGNLGSENKLGKNSRNKLLI